MIDDQIKLKLCESSCGNYYLCLDEDSENFGVVLRKFPDGELRYMRKALPIEIIQGNKQIENLNIKLGIPTKG